MDQSAATAKIRRGLLVSVAKEGSQLWISLDDVVNSADFERTWTQKEHVTSKTIDEQLFQGMQFDEKELANFAYYIMARLKAFLHRREN